MGFKFKRSFIISSTLTREEAVSRLAGVTFQTDAVVAVSALTQGYQFFGKVYSDGFQICESLSHMNGLFPHITGRMTNEKPLEYSVEMKLTGFARGFIIAACIVGALVIIPIIIFMPLTLIFLAAAAAVGVVSVTSSFNRGVNRAEASLKALLCDNAASVQN